jgi:hypothetical protein
MAASSSAMGNGNATATGAIVNPKSALDSLVSISITCTGIDTLQELRKKYKDIEFVLRNIRKCNNEQSRTRVETKILHGVNAVEAECNNNHIDPCTNTACQAFDHVIFNHPHLGTEDAQLHSRFLQHLFHACAKRWMKPRTGLLYLTLVNGQCARWKCIEGAMEHGLVLLRRGPFCPPPPPPPPPLSITNIDGDSSENKVGITYYNLRRHQSGRSFANRRTTQSNDGASQNNGSETLVFGRDCNNDQAADIDLLPWKLISSDAASGANTSSNNHASIFPCKYCSKTFQEQRSLKNHLVSLHPTCEEVRTWSIEKCETRRRQRRKNGSNNDKHDVIDDIANTDMQQSDSKASLNDRIDGGIRGPQWICSICDSSRQFPHKGALLAHQQAKHFGVHLNIKPDWHHDAIVGENNRKIGGNKGSPSSCLICSKQFVSENDESLHAIEFLPSSAKHFSFEDSLQSKSSYTGNACAYCSRMFGGFRARRQHENFCSLRLD